MSETKSNTMPPRSETDYKNITKYNERGVRRCLVGVSPEWCDMVSEDYGGRCGCVKAHYEILKREQAQKQQQQ